MNIYIKKLSNGVRRIVHSLRRLLHCSLLLSVSIAVEAQEKNDPVTRDEIFYIDISGMDLSEALLLFANQSNTYITAKWDLFVGYRSSPIVGRYTIEKALSTLLANTDIDFSYQPHDRTITLKHRKNKVIVKVDDEQIESSQYLEEILVSGFRPRIVSGSPLDITLSNSIYEGTVLETLNISTLSEIERAVPSIMFGNSSRDGRGEISIRGVGHGGAGNSGNIGTNVRVPVFIDDVPSGRFSTLNQDLTDIQQIEILRGPQGALFGANTVVGAIRIVTKKPNDQFTSKISSEAGSWGYRKNWFSLNIPISDNIYSSSHYSNTYSDGFIYNETLEEYVQGKQREAGRLKFRYHNKYQNNDSLDVIFSFDGLNEKSRSIAGWLITQPETVNDQQMLELENYKVQHDAPEFQNRKARGYTLNIDYEFNQDSNINYNGGYRDNSFSELNDEDFASFSAMITDFNEKSQQRSHELKFSTQVNKSFDYVVGISYLEEDIHGEPRLIAGAEAFELLTQDFREEIQTLIRLGYNFNFLQPRETLIASSSGTVNTQSLSSYVHANYQWNQRLSLGASLRYIHDKKKINYQLVDHTGFSGLSKDINDDKSYYELLPMWGFNFSYSDSLDIYGNMATGYKSGGWNADMIIASESFYFGEEKATSYELGMKGLFFNERLNINLTGFKTYFDDFQVFGPTETFEIALSPEFIVVTEEAHTEGWELNSQYNVNDVWSFTMNTAYTLARFDSLNESGEKQSNALFFAPRWSAYIGLDYEKRISNTTNLRFNLNYHYVGRNYSLTRFRHEIPSRYLININASLAFGDNFEISMWGKNLTEESSITRWSTSFFGLEKASYQEPRSFGVAAKYLFH